MENEYGKATSICINITSICINTHLSKPAVPDGTMPLHSFRLLPSFSAEHNQVTKKKT